MKRFYVYLKLPFSLNNKSTVRFVKIVLDTKPTPQKLSRILEFIFFIII